MAKKKRWLGSNLALLCQCSKDLVYVVFLIREQLEELEYKRYIKQFTETRDNLPGGFMFKIQLVTGEEYELKISYSSNPKQEALVFKQIDSRRDKVTIHGVVDAHTAEVFIQKQVLEHLLRRVRGFNAEYFAFTYLKSVIVDQKSDLIVAVRKSTSTEDKNGEDFFLECKFGNQKMVVSFDLKNNQSAVQEARNKASKIPTIFTNEFELRRQPEKFLSRVHELIVKKFRKGSFGLKVGSEPKDMHIV